MYVSHLQLVDFRSYESALLELEPGVSVFVGANGQGKTNLVEAIGYVANLGSHRVSSDTPLVRSGATRAIVSTRVIRDGRDMLVDLEINPGKANRARVNRGAAGRPRDVKLPAGALYDDCVAVLADLRRDADVDGLPHALTPFKVDGSIPRATL